MSDETLQDNPFAAPAESLPVVETEATDDWYELRGDTLVCRSSLRLPMYCLVTGEACPESCAAELPAVLAARFQYVENRNRTGGDFRGCVVGDRLHCAGADSGE